ncbi:HPP family protein [Mariprofundus sp. KV]|uniref:HPP family protein n=1 Tax=Mariprofundus sp. KV TaxID=2608715 RepID=UPI0015A1D24A|nr:HPP family protein [Mariprofundus sp. KV]NWF36703.1 hypothetical protein [Mariprofundus sp. KV]
MRKSPLTDLIGIELNPSSHSEKLISGIGAFIAIFAIYNISFLILGEDALLLVTSMGAAAVLLFSVPHGPLSQPWPLFGGNMISAFAGVSCAQSVPDTFIAAAAAVGLSVTLMYYLKCIHPPGGATALSAVVSGSAVDSLGFQYVITPVLLNVLVIFSVAVLFNLLFKWRRYPARLAKVEAKNSTTANESPMLSHQSIEHALREIDSFIDISEEDLNRIYLLASEYDNSTEVKKGVNKPGQ